MAKIDTGFKFSPVTSKGMEAPGLFFLDCSSADDMITLTVYEQTNKTNYRQLFSVKKFYKTPTSTDLKGDIEVAISTHFKTIKCIVCGEKHYAIKITKTLLGYVCCYCWNLMHPKPEWEWLPDLKTYITKESA